MDLTKHIDESIEWGKLEVSKLTQDILDIHGITSNKVIFFIIIVYLTLINFPFCNSHLTKSALPHFVLKKSILLLLS